MSLVTSFPRSGNTLLRTYLEKIFLVLTGSDCDTKRKLNKQLLESGLRGEGETDGSKVIFVKSHFPERLGNCSFQAAKCVLVVRNVLDSILSLFHMIATSSHSDSMSESLF